MVKYKSRVGGNLNKVQNKSNPKQMASKVLDKKAVTRTGGSPASVVVPKLATIAKKLAPVIKKVLQSRLGAALPVGGVLPVGGAPLSDETIDQMTPLPFIHMLGTMDMPTFHILQGIASNFLRTEHPMRLITNRALGGSFDFPKNLSKIAMRDVIKSTTPQQLSGALHSEWLDMMSGKLTPEEVGGGLFSSLKTLVKKGVKGARAALSALGRGAAGAVRAISAGAMAGEMISRSVSNALMQGLEVANGLAPIIKEVFPSSEGILNAGLGHANAAQELLNRGIDISERVGQVVQPIVSALGDVNAPIVVSPAEEEAIQKQVEPVGAGLDSAQVSADSVSRDDTGERFTS